MTAALVLAATLCVVVFELARVRSWPGEYVSYSTYRDTRRTPVGAISAWVGAGFWTAAVMSIVLLGISWPWIAASCVLLIAPGTTIVWSHNRRVITEHEDRLPA